MVTGFFVRFDGNIGNVGELKHARNIPRLSGMFRKRNYPSRFDPASLAPYAQYDDVPSSDCEAYDGPSVEGDGT